MLWGGRVPPIPYTVLPFRLVTVARYRREVMERFGDAAEPELREAVAAARLGS